MKFDNKPIPGSPYIVDIIPAFTASACHAFGRGLQSTGVRINEKAPFWVNTEGAGEANLGIFIKGLKGTPEPVDVVKRFGSEHIYDCLYTPTVPGDYTVQITWGGQNIPKSPFQVKIGPEAGSQKVRAYGPGLRTGKVGHPACFVVETTGTEVGQLGFQIEGPSQTKIECDDCGDGSCDVKYFPTEVGEYAVHIICDGEDIKHSPYMATITEDDINLSIGNVKCFGSGIETGVPVCGQPIEFTIDATQADRNMKQGKPNVEIVAADGTVITCKLTVLQDGIWRAIYTPHKAIKHTLCVDYNGLTPPNAPFRVMVQEASHPELVQVSGPGIQPVGLRAKELTYFIVDCSRAGTGDISIGIKCASGILSEEEVDIDFDIIKNDNDTFTVKYTPPEAGRYTVMVLFADTQIPASPVSINVKKAHDESKVRCDGPALRPNSNQVGEKTHFTIFTRGAGIAEPKVVFQTKSGQVFELSEFSMTKNIDSSYTVAYVPEAHGAQQIMVTYGGDQVPGAPFPI